MNGDRAMEILKLQPCGKDYLWGGTRLRDEYGKKIDLTPLAETWECSAHPDGPSVITNGKFKGLTLAEALKEHPEYLGTKVKNGEFPILVKLIDAKKNLSVQVHPDDDYASRVENQNGKTEMWYVLDAEPGAQLVYGFEHNMDTLNLKNAVENGCLEKYLHKENVKKGDTIYVPAGTVHGIGAGVLIAEIQESSNVTYRVFDYNRVDKYGNKRELHFDKAVQVLDMKARMQTTQKHRLIHFYPGCSREMLCSCKYFEVEKINVKVDSFFSVERESFQVILCLTGNGQVELEDGKIQPVRFLKGDCLFFPAGLGNCHLLGNTELLKIRC